jgi:hypothetical protein
MASKNAIFAQSSHILRRRAADMVTFIIAQGSSGHA